MAYNIDFLSQELETHNFAEDIPEEDLDIIAETLLTYIDEDEQSRSSWLTTNEKWIKLASQIVEQKSTPWPKASNMKYPLLSVAAIQFHARSYPAFVNEMNLIKLKVHGKRTDEIMDRVSRVTSTMKYQLLEENEEWQEDMDQLLYILAIVGLAYKKTYFDPNKGYNVSELVLAQDLILNYNATDFYRARKTHYIPMDRNTLLENQRSGYYVDIDIPSPSAGDEGTNPNQNMGLDEIQSRSPSDIEEDIPHDIYESHCWYDVDGDGYKEPWIIVIEKQSKKILRMTPRFDATSVDRIGNKLAKINAVEYFTQFKFLPDPNSKLYAMGFGMLIGPTNSGVNTILNLLLDAGTLSNLQSGFLGKGIRFKGGRKSFRPGEWKSVNSTGDDIRKNVYPLPVREPSNVLFSLLGLLIESGERLASIKDIMTGENPGQNQPYATSMAVLEQGMKVFVGIHKRIYRALAKEYKKLYRLNGLYLEDNYAISVDGEQLIGVRSDFIDNEEVQIKIVPGADPSIISDAQNMLKANSLVEKMAAGLPLNINYVTRKVLEAEGHEDIEEAMQVQPQQPDPKTQLEIDKFQHQREKDMKELELKQFVAQYEPIKDYAQAIAHLAKAQTMGDQQELEEKKAIVDALTRQMDVHMRSLENEDKLNIEQNKMQQTKSVDPTTTETNV